MDHIVNAYNIFIDSESSFLKGDDFMVQCSSNGIHCSDGQFFRISVQSFNMYKNFYNVNEYNSELRLTTDGAAAVPTFSTFNIAHGDYSTVKELAEALAASLKTALVASTSGVGGSNFNVTPVTAIDNKTRIIQITFENTGAFSQINTNVKLQTRSLKANGDLNESSYLLGAKRVSLSTDNSSFTVSSDSDKVVFTAHFPCQRSTMEHIFLRTDLQSNNLETNNYEHSVHSNANHLNSSNILCKIPVDSEFIHYNDHGNKEYFVLIPNKSITSMKFRLTDSKDRPLPFLHNQNKADGNVSCSFVLLVEVLQSNVANALQSRHPQPKLDLKAEGVLTHLPQEV